MDLEALQTYFAAEKLTGIALAIYGLAMLGVAAHLHHTHSGSFMWGIVVPLGVVGLGALLGGSGLAIKTGPQMEGLLAMAPADLLAIELPRMQKVNANWPRLEAAWTVLIIGALVTLWAVRRDWATGLSLAMLVAATSAMVLDIFAERRALVYTATLERAGHDIAPPR